MATDTKLKELVINQLTQAQYDALETKDPNQVYLTPYTSGDAVVPTPPTAEGTYVLKATVVSDGTVTTSWVAEA